MSTKIDIYNYPENADPVTLARYIGAVADHFAGGGEVEGSAQSCTIWLTTTSPTWDWNRLRYRAVRPRVAEGHNPDKLTEAQVGVKDGWRLLAPKEIADRQKTSAIEVWWHPCGWQNGDWIGSDPRSTYRTKMPPGYFLPKPEKTQREKDEDALHVWTQGKSFCMVTHAWHAACEYARREKP